MAKDQLDPLHRELLHAARRGDLAHIQMLTHPVMGGGTVLAVDEWLASSLAKSSGCREPRISKAEERSAMNH